MSLSIRIALTIQHYSKEGKHPAGKSLPQGLILHPGGGLVPSGLGDAGSLGAARPHCGL